MSALKQTLREAVFVSCAKLIESLESREYLSVTTDANGWTVVTPSIDSRVVYVSSSTGSDTNTGLSPDQAFKTIAKAQTKMRSGFPDELLLNRGDTFATNIFISGGGRSASEPMLYSNYGDPTLARPIIDAQKTIGLNLGNPVRYLDVIGIDFTSSTHDPTSSNFTNQGSLGLQDLGFTDTLWVEDCRFRNFTTGVVIQGSPGTTYGGAISNVTFRRNQVVDSYTTNGNAQGLYAEQVTGLTIQDNLFDHNGWSSAVPGAGANQFSQNVYLHSSNNNVVATGNIFANAAATGLQARAGGIVDNNLFIANPTGLTFGVVNGATTKAGGVTGELIGNVILQSRDISGTRIDIGAMLGNLKPGGNVVMSNNLFGENPSAVNPAIQFQPGFADSNPQDEVGLNTLTMQNNIVANWGYGLGLDNSYIPGGVGAKALNGVVVRNNDFQNITTRMVIQGPLYDPRYEDWSQNRYSSSTAVQSSWFSIQGSLVPFSTWQSRIEPTASVTAVPYVDATRDVVTYMQSLGLTASTSAYLTLLRNESKGNWDTRFAAPTVNAYIEAGYVTDTAPPIVALAPVTDVTSDTTPTQTFTVTYSDNYAVNASTVASGNLLVTGPNGFSQLATLVSASGGNGPSVTATYSITAPNNTWTSVTSGTYVISLVGGQVKDISGNAIAGQNLGTFNVSLGSNLGGPAGPATTPASLSASAGAGGITLTWSDPAADQSSYVLQRADDAGFTTNLISSPQLGSATSYTDATAAVGKTYFYQLIAVNSAGASAPTPSVSATILPAAPTLVSTIFNDGNAARTTVTSITLTFSQKVTIDNTMVTLLIDGTTTAIASNISNPTGDGKTWVMSFSGTGGLNGTLVDGTYDLNIFASRITDAFGQSAGLDQVRTFTVDVAPRVLSSTYANSAPPHSLAFTFSKDVSASLAVNTLTITNGSTSYPPVAFSWNAATLTGTWTYSGAFPDNANAYTAKLPQTLVKDAAGVHLDGNGDGIPGDDFLFTFKQLKPSITLSGTSPILVNTAFTLTYNNVVDAGQTVSQYLIHWGDGNTDTFTTTGTASHTYAVAGTYTITADLTDANGTHVTSGSMSVQVNRALASLTGNNANANNGGTYTFNIGAVTDPGQTPTNYVVHWGDGTSGTFATTGPLTHVYSKTGTDTIVVDVIDGAGTSTNAGSFKVTVNAAPSAALTGNLNANQGGTYRLVVNAPSDPGYTVSQYLIHWGDGTTTTTSAAGTFTHSFSATGAKAITIDLTDSTGTYVSAGKLTTTVNPPPTIVLAGNSTDLQGDVYSLTLGAVTDPGQTVTQYTVHWGDGTTTNYAAAGVVTHTFAIAGTMNVTVDLTDGTGTFAAAGTKAITVNPSQAVALAGTADDDNFYIKLDPNGQSIDLWMNSTTPGAGTPDFVLSSLSSLTLSGLGGNDTLTVDETGGAINLPGGVTFDGGAGTNTLIVIGSAAADTVVSNGSQLAFGAGQVYYFNIAGITYNDGNGADNITVGGAVPLTLNLGNGSDTLNVAANANAIVNFGASNGDLTINGSGNTLLVLGTGSPNFSTNTAAIVTVPALPPAPKPVAAPVTKPVPRKPVKPMPKPPIIHHKPAVKGTKQVSGKIV